MSELVLPMGHPMGGHRGEHKACSCSITDKAVRLALPMVLAKTSWAHRASLRWESCLVAGVA